jgi:hypothetical protein
MRRIFACEEEEKLLLWKWRNALFLAGTNLLL